jgi:AraC family transcriptional regulator of arabinose operon
MSVIAVRREGFSGQHLITVPAPVQKATEAHPLLKGLYVTDAGYFPSAGGHRVERPHGAATHLIILCLDGEGWIKIQGRVTSVKVGEWVWLPADVPHAYGAAPDQPWTIVWAHFQGAEVAAWQRELGLSSKAPVVPFRFGVERGSSLGLDKVYAHLEAGYSIEHLLRASTSLRAVFCSMIVLIKGPGAVKTAAERTAAVREDIVSNPARHYRLEELATAAGLSVPHFCLLFRQQSGYAPIDFLIRQRIRRACRLLDTTESTIALIAGEVGFEDPYYFSRCFHRIMGFSPRAYRKSIKG